MRDGSYEGEMRATMGIALVRPLADGMEQATGGFTFAGHPVSGICSHLGGPNFTHRGNVVGLIRV